MDELVKDRFFAINAGPGVLVEVGAAHPEYLSVGALYRELGWTVVAIEPNPEFCELHRALGHEILQYACGDRDADDVDFSIVDSGGVSYRGGRVTYESFSSLAIKGAYAQLLRSDLRVRTIKVALRRLDTVLEEHAPAVDHVDMLVIDVEGWELEVLSGFDLDRFAPRVVILENLFSERTYRLYMHERGYRLWRHIEPNDVYVKRGEMLFGDRMKAVCSGLLCSGRHICASVSTRVGGARGDDGTQSRVR